MAGRLKKYWKIGLILGLITVLGNASLYLGRNVLVSYIGMRVVDAQNSEVDPDKLALDDFGDIPGVTQEYVDAYKLFLKVHAGERQQQSYPDVVTAFEKIAASTDNPELKLRSLYMVTLNNFIQGKVDESYKSGLAVLSLSKELSPNNALVVKLDKVVSAITNKEIENIEELNMVIEDQPTSEFAEDLNKIVSGKKDFQALKEKLETKKAAKSNP